MYDVIVVGAGPAGAMLAYWLAREGKKVLILEKEKLPRYKTCGGGVTVRAQKLIPFDISEVFERTIYDLVFSFRMGRSFTKFYPEPICFMTMRDRLDYFLDLKAQQAGAELLEGTKVTDIICSKEKVCVVTQKDTFEALFVAGCDGANSIVAHKTGLAQKVWTGVALEMECAPCGREYMENWRRKAHLDVGTIPGGYAWIFPKAKHLSVGVGGPNRFAQRLRSYLEEYSKMHSIESVKFLGHKLPILKPGSKINSGRVLLAGDAACLIDSLSGEGIYFAVKSAKIAARSLIESLDLDSPEVLHYGQYINKELAPELFAAALAVKIFSRAPRFFTELIERHDRVWNFGCKIFRGEETYTSLRRRLFIPEPLSRVLAHWNPLGW